VCVCVCVCVSRSNATHAHVPRRHTEVFAAHVQAGLRLSGSLCVCALASAPFTHAAGRRWLHTFSLSLSLSLSRGAVDQTKKKKSTPMRA
jgi:hypothetical protein